MSESTHRAPQGAPSAAPAPDAAQPPVEEVRFDELDLSDHLLEALDEAGYVHATPVQIAAIPHILEGREVVVQARTGTGKTAAFGLPLLELLDADLPRVQALVLTPTRELAQQVAGEINRLGKRGGIFAAAVRGGDSMTRQLEELRRGAQIVVGTPGRVLDHLKRGTIDTGRVRFFVLDEADEMLSMGFAKELNDIVRRLPPKRKTLLFSATFPELIERLVARHVKDPVRVQLEGDDTLKGNVEHHWYLSPRADKDKHLVAVLDAEGIESAIVFCSRRDETRAVARSLQRAGYHALPINSDLSQAERDEVMGAIRRGDLTVLVATDIAARGIDISDLRHVVNYSTPESPEAYVHRTGRTGRLGRPGTAITLVSGNELSALKAIEGIKDLRLEERRLPPDDVIMEHRVSRLMHDLKRLAALKSPEDRIRGEREDWQRVAAMLQSEPENKEVLYLLLQSFFEGVRKSTAAAASRSEGVAEFLELQEPDGDRGPAAQRGGSSSRGGGASSSRGGASSSRGGASSSRGGASSSRSKPGGKRAPRRRT